MKKIAVMVVGVVLVGVVRSYAITLPRNSVELGLESYYHRYKEPGVMRNQGFMNGLQAAYSYHDALMFKGEMRAAFGLVDYKNSGTMDDLKDFNFELRGMGGYDFQVSERFILTPYFGLGYRYLNDDSSGKLTSTGAAGYDRESNYVYSPLGLDALFAMDERWSLGGTLEYDAFWWGRQISHLEDANRGFDAVSNTQKKGYGFRSSVRLQMKGEGLDFVIEPFIRYWYVKKSNNSSVTYNGVIIGYGYEPKNNTTEYGVKISVRY